MTATSSNTPGGGVDPLVLAASLDALDEGIQVLSFDFRYLYLNEAAARQGQKPLAELVGRAMRDCYPGIDATPMFARLERCMRERRSDALENEFEYEGGQRAWFELRIRPCEAGLVVISLDMTARKSVEEQLREAHRRALRELATPIVRIHRGVLLVPIVGALEGERASRIDEEILTRVVAEAAKVVIFDVAGVPELDTAVANHLLQTTAMIRLLGAATILTGISAEAAKTMVELGIDLAALETRGRLADGLERAVQIVTAGAAR
ncbi:MAG TPA: PAS domain-containing protein [Minicystis sp.]|nr:PAS domain-containing protein [Minicystis sp.]